MRAARCMQLPMHAFQFKLPGHAPCWTEQADVVVFLSTQLELLCQDEKVQAFRRSCR